MLLTMQYLVLAIPKVCLPTVSSVYTSAAFDVITGDGCGNADDNGPYDAATVTSLTEGVSTRYKCIIGL